jgi:hypothetical protein
LSVGATFTAIGWLTKMITLESFKLLNPKVARLERGSGGTPEITFQEVSDCLAAMNLPAAAWARLKYAQQGMFSARVLSYVAERLIQDGECDDGVLSQYWLSMAQLAVVFDLSENQLTNRRKAKAIGIKWWTKNNEKHLSKCLFFVDQLDYEVRASISAWNRGDL